MQELIVLCFGGSSDSGTRDKPELIMLLDYFSVVH